MSREAHGDMTLRVRVRLTARQASHDCAGDGRAIREIDDFARHLHASIEKEVVIHRSARVLELEMLDVRGESFGGDLESFPVSQGQVAELVLSVCSGYRSIRRIRTRRAPMLDQRSS